MEKFRFIIQLLVLVVLSCSDRDQIGSRLNSYDPGGNNWKYHYKPTATVEVDSVWYDYNQNNSSGAVLFHASAKDTDLPHDTLHYKMYYGPNRSELDSLNNGTDSLILLKGLRRGIACYCSLVVADSWDSSCYIVKKFTAPKQEPPHPPAPGLSFDSSITKGIITLSWPLVIGADKYNVYKADSVNGKFRLADTCKAASDSDSVVTYSYVPNDSLTKYFTVASVNSYGECRSLNTIETRKLYGDLTPPSISSVSSGTYKTHIAIKWNRYRNAAVYRLYRSISSEGPFELIAKVDKLFYNDTVPTFSTYYYCLAYTDSTNRSSMISPKVYKGYRYCSNVPNIIDSTKRHPDYINVSWEAVSGMKAYVIYRSISGCDSRDFTAIDTVSGTDYHDSVSDYSVYYYRVASMDSSKTVGVQSACYFNTLDTLNAPSLYVSKGTYKNKIYLNWSTVNGAVKYIIYRSETTSFEQPLDTVTGVSYYDTIQGPYNYTVRSIGKIGLGPMSIPVPGYTSRPLVFSETDGSSSGINLKWTEVNGTPKYYIYKSNDNKVFSKYDSTNINYYTDSAQNYGYQYYKVSYRISNDDESELSSVFSGYRRLSSPANLKAHDMIDSVKLTWSKVSGADIYIIYRKLQLAYSYESRDTVKDTTWTDKLSGDYKRYSYYVAAQNKLNQSHLLHSVNGGNAMLPKAPIMDSTRSYADYIQISWAPDSTGSNSDGYYIYRSMSLDSVFVIRDSTTQTIYNDSIPDQKTYYYKTAGYNIAGTGTKSSVVSGSRK